MVAGQQLEDRRLLGRIEVESLLSGPGDEPLQQLVRVAPTRQPVGEQGHDGRTRCARSASTSAWAVQPGRWSLTMPMACMKA